MDQTTLVGIDFSIGARLLAALDQASLSISVAMWVRLEEYGDWRFALSSRRLDAVKPADAFGLVHDALEGAGVPYQITPSLLILRMSDPFIRELRRTFGKTKDVEGMRLGGQLFGDRFIEDALVYRIR